MAYQTAFTIEAIKANHEHAGLHFFEKASMRFFRSRISPGVMTGNGLSYFITSEQFSFNSKRLYTIRAFNPEDGSVNTVGDFQEYATLGRARTALKRLIKAGIKAGTVVEPHCDICDKFYLAQTDGTPQGLEAAINTHHAQCKG